tara:strand:- start:58 stop:255 length:198 start_codon:yes stop_codon:yes gene_type:complete
MKLKREEYNFIMEALKTKSLALQGENLKIIPQSNEHIHNEKVLMRLFDLAIKLSNSDILLNPKKN